MKTPLPLNIGRPATAALASVNIACLEDLQNITERELAALHGVGPKAVGILTNALNENNLSYGKSNGEDVKAYHQKQTKEDRLICEKLHGIITQSLPQADNRVWHAHPVWFLDGNPIVGYDKLKDSVRLLFWSGQSFNESRLTPEGTFKAAEVRYTDINQIDADWLKECLEKSIYIQWDYKNIMKNRKLVPLKGVSE